MGFLSALQFLTVIPVKRGFTAEQIGRSSGYFPLVGMVISGILVGLNYVLSMVLPSSVANILLIGALAMLSGGHHLDGLIDTCDGIAGHRTPEERWQIMRDSHAGGFGIIGIALLLLTKYIALNSLPQSAMAITLAIAPVISRWTMVYAIFAYPYAQPSGMGKAFKEATGWRQLVMATLVMVALSLALWKISGLAIIAAILLLTVLTASYLKRKFAGLTGDTYGAINEITESAVFILASLLVYKHWLV